jgi:hypothetical protein
MTAPLPPIIPDTPGDVDEAVKYLGHLVAGHKFRPSVKLRLIELIGSCPSGQTAGVWKTSLKGLSREMRELDANVKPAQRAETVPKAPEPDKRATYRDPPEQAPTTARKRVLDVSDYTPVAVKIFKRKGAER